MNGVKGPLYGHQTDDEDSLSDTNKPKEDEEKQGLNKKIKKLKRSWSYLKESSQIIEPSTKSRKISPKVRKNATKFKSKKEEIWKEDPKKSTKYKKVDQKSNEKAEQILKSEKYAGEVKTTKNLVYICSKCTMSSERNAAIQCTRCKQWHHDECFKYCFALSLKSNYLYCFKCIIFLYRNIGNFFSISSQQKSGNPSSRLEYFWRVVITKLCIPR